MTMGADTQLEYGRRDASPALDDVEQAIRNINGRESYAFHVRPEVPVRLRAHIQGIVRIPCVGNSNWFVMSKHHHERAQDAGLLFVEWPKVKSQGGAFAQSAGSGGPGVGKLRHFWGRGRSEHPGGLQLCGQILVVAQDPLRAAPFISFVDVANPRKPVFIGHLTLDGAHGEGKPKGVTCAALTRLADQHYLLFVYRYSSSRPDGYRGWFFRSREPFLNQNTGWTLQHQFGAQNNQAHAAWSHACDNMTLLNQADGALYLVAVRGQFTDNHLDVYRLEGDTPQLTFCFRQPVRTRPFGATFRAGASLHITPDRQLVIYASEKAGGGRIRNLMVEEFSP